MKATIAIGCVLLAASHACGQVFTYIGDSRFVSVHADSADQEAQADRLMPFDVMLSEGTPSTGFASAWQTSRLSETEIFISGGTGEVLWEPTTGNVRGTSGAHLTFRVSSPAQVRIHYELTIDTTSFHTWTAGADLISRERRLSSVLSPLAANRV